MICINIYLYSLKLNADFKAAASSHNKQNDLNHQVCDPNTLYYYNNNYYYIIFIYLTLLSKATQQKVHSTKV